MDPITKTWNGSSIDNSVRPTSARASMSLGFSIFSYVGSMFGKLFSMACGCDGISAWPGPPGSKLVNTKLLH